MHGLYRSLINNMVVGVSEGFQKDLEIIGVGYKAAISGSTLTLNLGYSHPIDYKLPKGVTAVVNKNIIEFHGCDKELVGFVAAQVRSFREPEPYKGKGLKYTDEKIIRKAGKTGAKK
jgi:large subunit ribosomal protein L6